MDFNERSCIIIGLKHFKTKTEGSSLKHRIKDLWRELGYAWQRAWNGYDETMWWSLDYSFIELYKDLITELRDNHFGHPVDITPEEWIGILDEMLYYLDGMVESEWFEGMDTMETYREAERNKDKFFELFSKYFYTLWD